MKIDPAARPFTVMAAVPTVVAAVVRAPRTTFALGLLTAGVTLFFRDPDRTPDRSPVSDPDVVLAPADGIVTHGGQPAEHRRQRVLVRPGARVPADGIVTHAGEPQPGVAPPGEWQQVSIFLSLLDVHINRSPYGGHVVDVTHTPGRFLAAYRAESAMKNERSEVVVEQLVSGRTRRVVYRQLVGQLARRIVTRLEPGDEVATGERMGLMKFGSRMDVFVPPEVVLEVARGTRAVGGETVLGRFPAASPVVSVPARRGDTSS